MVFWIHNNNNNTREIALIIQLWRVTTTTQRVLGGWVGRVGRLHTNYLYPARWGWINFNLSVSLVTITSV